MYTEFIVIFVLLGLVIVISVFNMILLIMLKRESGYKANNVTSTPLQFQNTYMNQNMMQGTSNSMGSVVFCRNCAKQYDATLSRCPNCGTPR